MVISKSERKYDMFVISLLIVFFSVLWFVGSVNLVRQMQKHNQITGFAISDKDNTTNQTQPQEIYSVKSYTIFYLSVIFMILVVAVISLILIVPRIKKYT